MKRKIFTILSFLLFIIELPVAQNKTQALKTFIHSPALQNASISVCIKKLSGEVVLDYNSNLALTPASTLKVLTTATALEIFGADFRYATTLGVNPSDESQIIINGSGDPTLGSERMYENSNEFLGIWADAIISRLGNNKKLKLYIDDSLFGYDAVSKKWLREDIGNYYAASAFGISVFDNTYCLYLNSTKASATPSIVKTEPQIAGLNFINALSVNFNGRDNAFIIGDPFTYSRLLKGNIPNNRKAFVIKGSIPDPALTLGNYLAEKLQMLNINVESVATAQKEYYKQLANKAYRPIHSNVFHTHYSNPLGDIIREVNVRSNNHYAEHLIRTIGRSDNQDIYEDALELGIDKLSAFWQNKGFETKHLFLYDGCGLSPSDAISSGFLTDILIYMQTKSRYEEVFLNSLPVAGEDGTVRNFLKGTKLAGRVHLKSGSIAGVQCYSGYYINGEEKYAMTIFVNKFNSPRNQITRAIRSLLLNVF